MAQDGHIFPGNAATTRSPREHYEIADNLLRRADDMLAEINDPDDHKAIADYPDYLTALGALTKLAYAHAMLAGHR